MKPKPKIKTYKINPNEMLILMRELRVRLDSNRQVELILEAEKP